LWANYCARKIWKKLSISVGVNKKLRRLSSVGSHDFEESRWEAIAATLFFAVMFVQWIFLNSR